MRSQNLPLTRKVYELLKGAICEELRERLSQEQVELVIPPDNKHLLRFEREGGIGEAGTSTWLAYYLRNEENNPFALKKKTLGKDYFASHRCNTGVGYRDFKGYPHNPGLFQFCGYKDFRTFLTGMIDKEKLSIEELETQENLLKGETDQAHEALVNASSMDSHPKEFCGKTYYLYFFYKSYGTKKTSLGRTVLEIDKKGNVQLKNVPDGTSPNYVGTSSLTNKHVLCLDLVSVERAEMRTHIKIISFASPREISVGGYISFEHERIVLGTVLLYYNSDTEHFTPKLLSSHENPEEFNTTELAIRKYLSLKSQNRIQTPHDIVSLESLKKLFKTYKPNREDFFFDVELPILFISAPKDSIDKSKRDQIEVNIKELEKKLETEFEGHLSIQRWEKFKKGTRAKEAKRKIRETHFFVLIYPDPGAASFALIELGLAIGFSKRIIAFHGAETSIPDRIMDSHIHPYPFTPEPNGSLDWDYVFKKIKRHIEDDLDIDYE